MAEYVNTCSHLMMRSRGVRGVLHEGSRVGGRLLRFWNSRRVHKQTASEAKLNPKPVEAQPEFTQKTCDERAPSP